MERRERWMMLVEGRDWGTEGRGDGGRKIERYGVGRNV